MKLNCFEQFLQLFIFLQNRIIDYLRSIDKKIDCLSTEVKKLREEISSSKDCRRKEDPKPTIPPRIRVSLYVNVIYLCSKKINFKEVKHSFHLILHHSTYFWLCQHEKQFSETYNSYFFFINYMITCLKLHACENLKC